MEVCQDGIDGVLPAWCVPVDLSMDTRIQLMIEIAILGFLFAGVFAFGKWKRKRDRQKRLNTSQEHQ